MLTLVGLLLVALAGLLQTAVLPVLLPQLVHIDVRPDLSVLCIVAVALAENLREATIWAFGGGILLDLLSGLPLGSHALCLLVVAMLANLGTNSPFRANLIMPLAMVFACTVFYFMLLLSIRSLLGEHFSWWDAFSATVLPTALFNVALMPPVYSFVLWLAGRFQTRLPQEWQ